MQKASGRLETIPQSASLTAPFTQGSLGWVRITQCTLSPVASLTCGWERKSGGVDMKLSPSGGSAMERVHSDALLVQKEMGWNRPRVDVGIDPYEGDGHVSHVTSSDRPSGGHLPLKGKALGALRTRHRITHRARRSKPPPTRANRLRSRQTTASVGCRDEW